MFPRRRFSKGETRTNSHSTNARLLRTVRPPHASHICTPRRHLRLIPRFQRRPNCLLLPTLPIMRMDLPPPHRRPQSRHSFVGRPAPARRKILFVSLQTRSLASILAVRSGRLVMVSIAPIALAERRIELTVTWCIWVRAYRTSWVSQRLRIINHHALCRGGRGSPISGVQAAVAS